MKLGGGDNRIGESPLYACFLVYQNKPVLNSLRDILGVGAWGLWQYKSFQFNLIVHWEESTKKMTLLTNKKGSEGSRETNFG